MEKMIEYMLIRDKAAVNDVISAEMLENIREIGPTKLYNEVWK